MVEVPKRAFQPLTGTRHGVRQIPKYCEEFLAGIVPDAALAALLDDLGGTGWKDPDIERRLKERLRKSFNSYFETITDLNELLKTHHRLVPCPIYGNLRVSSILAAW